MIRIIPEPMLLEKREGALSLCAVRILADKADQRITDALRRLSIPESEDGKTISVSHGTDGEGYALSVNENGIEINADGPAGAFYAVQSLRQLICENGRSIPCCYIEDRPDLSYRGFYLDISRGRVPTLKKLKSIADTLSFYKINSLQLYVEAAFTFRELRGVATPENALTPEEITELEAYCKERFIDLIPSMSSFGHLFALLQSTEHRRICELEDYEMTRNYWLERQWHHTLDPYDPRSIEVIGSMIDQFAPLFSSKYFNICCDETMDLCMGKNLGKDKGEAYFHHVEKLICKLREHGKTPMLWGDECMARPDMAKEKLPDDAIILNWCYRHKVAEWIPRMFCERGFSQICCTGTSCWENFIENVNISCGNISSFASHAKSFGTVGLLNTSWGDFGHVCPFNSNLYGLLMGAEKSWRVDSRTDAEFETASSLLLYGVTEFNMADTLRALGTASSTCSWSDFVVWHSATHLEEKDATLKFGYGPRGENTAEDAASHAELCRRETKRLLELGRNDDVICDLILSARAIELMNRLALYVNRIDGYCDAEALQKDFDDFISDYSRAWLRDDKPSELPVLEEFIRNITK